MAAFTYYSHGKPIQATVAKPSPARGAEGNRRSAAAADAQAHAATAEIRDAMDAQAGRFGHLFGAVREAETLVMRQKNPAVTMLATETVVVEGATKADLKVLRDKYGMTVVREGLFGKTLLRSTDDGGAKAVANAFACAAAAYKRRGVEAAHPNFIRLVEHIRRRAPGAAAAAAAAAANGPWWHHSNDGSKGVRGADGAVRAAWNVHRGDPAVRVAVLDEGVDDGHPDLKAAVAAQKDFVDGNPSAAPDGDDAHGTACAGIIAGRGSTYPGVCGCSLVAVRIAKGDGNGNWIFDDFATADAIDWAWKDGKADVLSNTWGGGLPVDAISNAFERARTKGRGGKGSVIAIAAGNANRAVNYPATLPEILCVGASNEWDERKSPGSKDGESWWGSCFGPELSLMAPGVHIATTDISGTRGYGNDNYTLTFNGTSSATPQVAAAAALVLSVAPQLGEAEVRAILTEEAAKMSGSGRRDAKRLWNRETGWGRLDIHAAVRRALHP